MGTNPLDELIAECEESRVWETVDGMRKLEAKYMEQVIEYLHVLKSLEK